jgi:hypothetical protein
MTGLHIIDRGKGDELLIRHDGRDHYFPISQDEQETAMYRIKAALAARQKLPVREWR